MPGYSGTPLFKKLGLKSGVTLCIDAAPPEYLEWIEPLPEHISITRSVSGRTDIVHLFTTDKSKLARRLEAYRKALNPSATVWVSWPKKAAKIETDVTEDTIRSVALPLGFVDIKVCAISDVWSGLKLVVRKELR